MKLTLTKIHISDKDKDGKPFISKKDGKPYSKIGVLTQEYGKRWLSGFVAPWNAFWKEGDTVDADVEENGQYLNLKKPDPLKRLEERVSILEQYMRGEHVVQQD